MFEQLKTIWRNLTAKQSTQHRTLVAVVGGQPIAPPGVSYTDLAEDGYQRNPYVFAAICEIARAVATLPWYLVRRERDRLVEIEEHPILKTIRRPNELTGQGRFLENVIKYLYISGNSYIEAIPPEGSPSELWTLRPDRIRIIPGNRATLIARYELTTEGGGDPTAIKPESILHLKTFHPTDDWYGLSPIEVARWVVEQSNKGDTWNTALLVNQGNPPGFFVAKGAIDDDQFQRFQQLWQDRYAGAMNAGRMPWIDGDVDWKSTGLPPSDMEWSELSVIAGRKIAIALGVPPEILGDSASKTYSNYKEARKAFYLETVLPLAGWIRDEFNNWLIPKFTEEQIRLEFNRDAVDAIQEDRAELVASLDKAWWLTLNEKREAIGYDEVSDGDVILVPTTLAPLGSELDAPPTEEPPKSLTVPPGVKVFRWDTEEKKRVHWKSIDAARTEWLERVARQVKRLLTADVKAVSRMVGQTPDPFGAVDGTLSDRKPEWTAFISWLYLTVGADFADRTADALGKMLGTRETKESMGLWEVEVRNWIEGPRAGAKIKMITDTTRKAIVKALHDGMSAGEGIDKLGDRVEDTLLPIIPNRAEVVARTEVIQASNLAGQSVAKTSGIPLQKEWLSTRDNRTRTADEGGFDHLKVDGQRKGLDEWYEVSGEKLMFPGDPTYASAGNTIQCRCTEVYEPLEG